MQWNEAFRSKVMSADEAVKVIRSGDHVWIHAGCNAPTRADPGDDRTLR